MCVLDDFKFNFMGLFCSFKRVIFVEHGFELVCVCVCVERVCVCRCLVVLWLQI